MTSLGQCDTGKPLVLSPKSPQSPRERAPRIYDNVGKVFESYPASLLQEFLLKQPMFRWVEELKDRGWANPEGDVKFQNLRSRSDQADRQQLDVFYKQMQEIGAEMQSQTHALSPHIPLDETVRVLDLCMAPGGYSRAVLKLHNDAIIRGISLPRKRGGHLLHLDPKDFSDGQVQCLFEDVTMFAAEFGVKSVPEHHPERSSFLTYRPYVDTSFNLIFADGQILRTHERLSHRERFEKRRLLMSQLILALQRMESGGTFVILLHKVEAWDTVWLLYQFSQFSQIQLFKQKTAHRFRSSFYLVAKKVKPESRAAMSAMAGWKAIWYRTTFGGPEGTGEAEPEVSRETVEKVIEEFGAKLVKMAKPIWTTQGDALRKSDIWKGDKPGALGAGYQAFLWREAAKREKSGTKEVDESLQGLSIMEEGSSPTEKVNVSSPTTDAPMDRTPFRVGRRFTNSNSDTDTLRMDGEPMKNQSPLSGWRARAKAKEEQRKALEGQSPTANGERGNPLEWRVPAEKSHEPTSPSDGWCVRTKEKPKSPAESWRSRTKSKESPVEQLGQQKKSPGMAMGWRARMSKGEKENEKILDTPRENKVDDKPKCSDWW